MGRMTKYLKQTASIECVMLNDDGTKKLDVYGQPMYATPVTVKCRKEPYTERSHTGYGQYKNFTTTYYFDETVKVENGDKIDGQDVQRIEDYVDGSGTLVGKRVDV